MKFVLIFLLVGGALVLVFQDYQLNKIQSEKLSLPNRFVPSQRQTETSEPKRDVFLAATLVDAEKQSDLNQMTVVVKVKGVDMKPEDGHPHLHYRLDDGAVIGTSATRLNFYELSPGPHSIHLSLVDGKHKPLGFEDTLTIDIPDKSPTR